MDWYPKKLRVNPEGSVPTLEFISNLYGEEDTFHYAEIGVYQGSTALRILEKFPNAVVSLFDYDSALDGVKESLDFFEKENRVNYFGNTQKYCDSYNWSLIKLLQNSENFWPFDYVYIDGSHTLAVDGLTFFICDKLLALGGHQEFDDYSRTLKGSSLDPELVPETALCYTDEQVSTAQVSLIVDLLVKTDPRYRTVMPNRIFQKILN